MRTTFFLVIVLLSNRSNAQVITLSGKVIGSNSKGIPFAVCQLKNNQGFYTDENGLFKYNGNLDSIQFLRFSCIGYEPKEIPLHSLTETNIVVQLQERPNVIKEVVISGKKTRNKAKTAILGRKVKPMPMGAAYFHNGWERAILLKGDSTKNGILKTVSVYITNQGLPNTKFRIHIYELDSVDGFPGKDITDSNLIVHANKGNEWVRVDLSSKRIPVGKGLFVSVEWIQGYGNSEAILKTGTIAYQGQVLSLTLGYGYTSISYSRLFGNDWYQETTQLNPTIYGTYTYYK